MIPDKKEFKRTEVEKIASLSGKVLDYWEEEFAVFSPKKINGEKIYLHKDVLTILKLKQYLTVDRLNKAEIKEKLTDNKDHIVKKIEKEVNVKEQNTHKPAVQELNVPQKKPKVKKKNIKKGKKNAGSIESVPIFSKKKDIDTDNSNLDMIKEDLQQILTILKNNDKNSV